MKADGSVLQLPGELTLSTETVLARTTYGAPGSEAYLTTHRVIKFWGDYGRWSSVSLYHLVSILCRGRKLTLLLPLHQHKSEIDITCETPEDAREFGKHILWVQSELFEMVGMKAAQGA